MPKLKPFSMAIVAEKFYMPGSTLWTVSDSKTKYSHLSDSVPVCVNAAYAVLFERVAGGWAVTTRVNTISTQILTLKLLWPMKLGTHPLQSLMISSGPTI